MEKIDDIVDCIILKIKADDNTSSLSNLKLQKLLYYIQAWSYGINRSAFFEGEFEAWVHGPVNRAVFDRFNSTKHLYSEINLDDCINKQVSIDDNKSEFVDFILENYAKFSGAELERISHSETPWIKARGNFNAYERCNTEITIESMIEFYGRKWEEINSK